MATAKSSTGFAAVLVAAVTAAHFVTTPASRVQVSEAGSAPLMQKHRHPPRHESAVYKGGCSAFLPPGGDSTLPEDENRGVATEVLNKFFGTDPSSNDTDTLPRGVHYVVSLAPDPVHTNLSLMFDREMVMIQQAAQDERYTYDSYWLPWRTGSPNYPLLADQQYAADLSDQLAACPGLLLFRRNVVEDKSLAPARDAYTEGLVVLVVGEQPTGGINKNQWTNAMLWLQMHAADDTALRVLGPTFTGSLISLDRELEQIYPRRAELSKWPALRTKFPEARIYSGSVTGCSAILWFERGLEDRNMYFGTFHENDELQTYRLLQYLRAEGTAYSDVAIVSEDETAYAYSGLSGPEPPVKTNEGQKPPPKLPPKKVKGSPCEIPYPEVDISPQKAPQGFSRSSTDRPVRLFYPRDISAVRAAYQKQSLFAAPSGGANEHSTHTVLEDDVDKDNRSGEASDTIQGFSGDVTPLAQEAQLYGIVSYLRTHHTRYIVLRCSNPLDYLFLTRFFHRAYPQARIVTMGADLLFRREVDSTEFRGTMALSDYPLLPRAQHWSMLSQATEPPHEHSHRIFDSYVEGMYVAGRYLIGDDRPEISKVEERSGLPRPIRLPLREATPDYADPFWLHDQSGPPREAHPPTWLSVVGRDGYWPIAVLNERTTRDLTKQFSRNADDPNPLLQAPPSTMVNLIANYGPCDVTNRAPRAMQFWPQALAKLPLPWIICGFCSFLLLLYQLAGVVFRATPSSDGLFSVFRNTSVPSQSVLLGLNCALAVMPLLATLSAALIPSNWRKLAANNHSFDAYILLTFLSVLLMMVALYRHYPLKAVVSFLVSFLSLAIIVISITTSGAVPANDIPLFYRFGHLTAGVSPLLPIILLCAGFYLWSWQTLAANLMLGPGRPELPPLEPLPQEEPSSFQRMWWAFSVWVEHQIGLIPSIYTPGRSYLRASTARISSRIGKRIVRAANPLSLSLPILAPSVCLAVGIFLYFRRDNLPLLTMEGATFTVAVNLILLVAFLLIVSEGMRFFCTWIELRHLLHALNRLRLRRTFAKLRAINARSLWSMSGNVQSLQYHFFSEELDAASRLIKCSGCRIPGLYRMVRCGRHFKRANAQKLSSGSMWEHKRCSILSERGPIKASIREVSADAVADVINDILIPEWGKEISSLNLQTISATGTENAGRVPDMSLSKSDCVQNAEEFVCIHYLAFIQMVLARMRTMTISMIFLFVSVCFAISSYPFVPRTQIGLWMLLNLALVGGVVIFVYASMERDETLSFITDTPPGRLGADFWIKTITFLAGPVIAVITTQFPSIADSVLSWLQPGLDAMR